MGLVGAMDSGDSDQACPRCGAPRRPYLRYCPACAFDLGDPASAHVPGLPDRTGPVLGMVAVQRKAPVVSETRLNRWWLPLTLLGSALPFVLIWLVLANPFRLAGPIAPAPPGATNWAPAGFEIEGDSPSLAWRWLGDSEYQCPANGVCAGVDAVARDGCPAGISGEITVQDQARIAVDTIRAESGPVAAGGHAMLVFDAAGLVSDGWARPPVLRCH